MPRKYFSYPGMQMPTFCSDVVMVTCRRPRVCSRRSSSLARTDGSSPSSDSEQGPCLQASCASHSLSEASSLVTASSTCSNKHANQCGCMHHTNTLAELDFQCLCTLIPSNCSLSAGMLGQLQLQEILMLQQMAYMQTRALHVQPSRGEDDHAASPFLLRST